MSLECFLISQIQITIPMIPMFLCLFAGKKKKKGIFSTLEISVRYTLYISMLTFVSLVLFWRYFLLIIIISLFFVDVEIVTVPINSLKSTSKYKIQSYDSIIIFYKLANQKKIKLKKKKNPVNLMLIYISAVLILPPRVPPTLRRTTLIMLRTVM